MTDGATARQLRSVSEIRDTLTGRYDPVPLSEIAEYLNLLETARVITWK